MASKAVEKHSKAEVNAVDPAEEPSVEWGWHGGFPRASRAAGWFTVVALLIVVVTLQPEWVAMTWLILLIVGMIGGLLLDIRKRKLSWRR